MAKRFVSLITCGVGLVLAMANDANAYKPATNIDLRIRFENLQDFPEHTFFLKFRRGSSYERNESLQLIELKPGSATAIVASHIGDVFLLALPRGQKIEVPEAVSDEWIRFVPPGALQTAALTTVPKGRKLPGHPGDHRRRNSEIVYRVRIDAAAIEATCVDWISFDPPPSNDWIVFAVLAIFAAGVLWFLARSLRQSLRNRQTDS